MHYWEWGIEKNYSEWTYLSDDSLIARIHYRIGGLRDKFYNDLDEKEFHKLLIETLDMSIIFYRKYENTDILKHIKKYCYEIDKWLGKELLSLKFKNFEIQQDIYPQRLKIRLLNLFFIPKKGVKVTILNNNNKEVQNVETNKWGG